MPPLIIEVLTRGGAHSNYHRVSELPVHIGRALDNDIVLADAYISPVHLIIAEGDHGWIAVDQSSENGTFIGKDGKIEGATELVSGDLVTIGRTQLRIWSPEHQVTPALRLPAQQSIARRVIIPLFAFISILGTAALVTLNQFLNNANQTKLISLFANALPYLFFPLLWAGTCACAGFIVRRRAQFGLQLIVANGALVSVLVFTALTEYVDYFTSSTRAADIIQYTGMVLITALLLFVNLAITTGTADLRRAVISVVIGGGVIATVAVTDYASRFENHITPEYSQTLKPPYAKITRSIPLDQFIKESEPLFRDKKEMVKKTKGK